MGVPRHVKADCRVGGRGDWVDPAKQHFVAHDRVGNRLGHQGHAEATGHEADQGMDLRGLLDHLGIKAGGFTQGNELAVIAGAQGLRSEHEVFPGEIPQVDLAISRLGMMSGHCHHDLFIQQQARLDVFRRDWQLAHERDIRFPERIALAWLEDGISLMISWTLGKVSRNWRRVLSSGS